MEQMNRRELLRLIGGTAMLAVCPAVFALGGNDPEMVVDYDPQRTDGLITPGVNVELSDHFKRDSISMTYMAVTHNADGTYPCCQMRLMHPASGPMRLTFLFKGENVGEAYIKPNEWVSVTIGEQDRTRTHVMPAPFTFGSFEQLEA